MHPNYIDSFSRRISISSLRAALVPVDLQYASGSREHGLGKLLAKQGRLHEASYRFDRIDSHVVPNTLELLRTFRRVKAKIIYITLGCELPDFADGPPSTKAFFEATNNTVGTREHEIIDILKPQPGELVVNKRTQGAFASSGIETILRSLGIVSIYTSIWDSGTLREKVTLQLRLRAGESQLECNVWRLCERCFLFQGRPPTSNAFIGDALDTVLDRLDCKFV